MRHVFWLIGAATLIGCARVPEYQMPQGFSSTYQQILLAAENTNSTARPARTAVFFPRTAPKAADLPPREPAYRPAIASQVEKKRLR